jgi:threonine dehydrogenase-like Zn-dependent dehydrogenase
LLNVKALVWLGERKLGIEDLPEPVAEDSEVVLEVEVAGICGSDLHPYRGHPGPRVPPLVLGHEAVGHTEQGRFVVYPLDGCGQCERCLAGEVNLCASWRLIGLQRAGVFAERVAVPRACLVRLPDVIDPARAVLAEPLACCVGALLPHLGAELSRLLVLGCGPIGLLSVFLAARNDIEVIALDPLPERRRHAQRLGASHTVESSESAEAKGVDLVLDAAGFESTWSAGIAALNNGGTLVVLGLGQAEGAFPMSAVVRRTITIRGQFAYSRGDFAHALELLATSDFERDWISSSPLDRGAQAFANLVDRPAEYCKVLLRP